MIKLGNLTLNGTPRIAVGFKDIVSSHVLSDAKNLGLDVIEIRIDQFKFYEKDYVLRQVQKLKAFPTIATIRSKFEGGNWNLSEEARLELFRAIVSKVDSVDVELSSKQILRDVVKLAHSAKKLIVISYHNFDATPSLQQLNSIVDQAKRAGADIVKIATMALKKEDIITLAELTISQRSKNLITIGMGSLGLASRIFFPMLGSLLTYAYLGEPTAPGQLHYEDTFDYLRRFYPSFNSEKIDTLKILQKV